MVWLVGGANEHRENNYFHSRRGICYCADRRVGWRVDYAAPVYGRADWITGLTVAGVFHKSPKSKNGALESRIGLKGLCRKGAMLLIVLVAYRLDLMAGLHGVLRTGAIVALVCNEALSILENVGLMGVTYPEIIDRVIRQLLGEKTHKENDLPD